MKLHAKSSDVSCLLVAFRLLAFVGRAVFYCGAPVGTIVVPTGVVCLAIASRSQCFLIAFLFCAFVICAVFCLVGCTSSSVGAPGCATGMYQLAEPS